MSLRAVRQFVVHVQTFRNIQLWYQGVYFIKIQIYIEQQKQNKKNRIYAQPIAFTEAHLLNRQNGVYDTQIVESSNIDSGQSEFCTKLFQLRYFQQQVEVNDICHFRIQTNLQNNNQQYVLETSLCFYDSYKKQSKDIQLKKQSKCVKTNRYIVSAFNGCQSIHEYVPVIFQDQYFSMVNLSFHAIILDYAFRLSQIQLYQFVKLTSQEKKKIIQRLKHEQNNKNCLSQCLKNQFKTKSQKQVFKILQNSVFKEINSNFQELVQQYTNLFANTITQNQKKCYQKDLIYPNKVYQHCITAQTYFLQQNINLALQKNSQYTIIQFLGQINSISIKITNLWNIFLKLIKINPRFFNAYYENKYNQRQSLFWKNLIKTKSIISNDICVNFKYDLTTQGKRYVQFIEKQLQMIRKSLIIPHKVKNQQTILTKNELALMVIQKYSSQQNKNKNSIYEKERSLSRQFPQIQKVQSVSCELDQKQKEAGFNGIHLVVLVHGFQGSSYDMKLIKNYISIMFPQTMFLCASSNQELTDSDIFQMGKRLAVQVKSHIIQNFPHNTLGKLSFVGHSLGGLKIRAALPRLIQYKDKFQNFITFSSPHLGYKVNSSSVVQAGIWILQKMKESQCLKQLSMADNENPYQTTLYKLSMSQGLEHFKNIWLFSSKQDSYAPYESARIQIGQQFTSTNDPLKTIHCQMVRNILKNVRFQILKRLNVTFTINKKNLDSLIGRTAHIMFLENAQIVKGLLNYQDKIFA